MLPSVHPVSAQRQCLPGGFTHGHDNPTMNPSPALGPPFPRCAIAISRFKWFDVSWNNPGRNPSSFHGSLLKVDPRICSDQRLLHPWFWVWTRPSSQNQIQIERRRFSTTWNLLIGLLPNRRASHPLSRQPPSHRRQSRRNWPYHNMSRLHLHDRKLRSLQERPHRFSRGIPWYLSKPSWFRQAWSRKTPSPTYANAWITHIVWDLFSFRFLSYNFLSTMFTISLLVWRFTSGFSSFT